MKSSQKESMFNVINTPYQNIFLNSMKSVFSWLHPIKKFIQTRKSTLPIIGRMLGMRKINYKISKNSVNGCTHTETYISTCFTRRSAVRTKCLTWWIKFSFWPVYSGWRIFHIVQRALQKLHTPNLPRRVTHK